MRQSVCLFLFLLITGWGTIKSRSFPVNYQETEKSQQEAWNTVRNINRFWTSAVNPDSLGIYLHPEIVVFFPGGEVRLEGKQQVMESYRDFVESVKTICLSEKNPLKMIVPSIFLNSLHLKESPKC